jgi:hypothetical protein
VEEALRLGDLASKSVSGGTLVLPGEGGHTHALLDGGCRGLGVLQGRIKGAVGRPRRWRDAETSREERRWRRRGEGSGRRRHAVVGEERGPGAAEQQGVRRAHWTSTAAWRSTTVGSNRSRGRDGGGGASRRGQGRGLAREGGSQPGDGLRAPLTRSHPGDAEGGGHDIRSGRSNCYRRGQVDPVGCDQGPGSGTRLLGSQLLGSPSRKGGQRPGVGSRQGLLAAKFEFSAAQERVRATALAWERKHSLADALTRRAAEAEHFFASTVIGAA